MDIETRIREHETALREARDVITGVLRSDLECVCDLRMLQIAPTRAVANLEGEDTAFLRPTLATVRKIEAITGPDESQPWWIRTAIEALTRRIEAEDG